MSISPFEHGRSLVFDVTTTTCTLAPTYVDASSRNARHVAEAADKDKRDKYADLAQTYIVQPVAFETMGPASASTIRFIKTVGRKIASITGEGRSGDFLLQRLSLAVQRGNAAAVWAAFHRTHTFKPNCTS